MGILELICGNPLFVGFAGAFFGIAFATGSLVLLGLKWLKPGNSTMVDMESKICRKMDSMEIRLDNRIQEVKKDMMSWIDNVEGRLNGFILEEFKHGKG